MLTEYKKQRNAQQGGGKSTTTPNESRAHVMATYKRRIGKRAMLMGMFVFAMLLACLGRSEAKQISKHLSPELYNMVLNNDPEQVVDVIVQYKKTFQKAQSDKATKRRARMKMRLDLIKGVNMSIPLSEVSDLADDSDVKYITLDRSVKMTADDTVTAVSADIAWGYGYDGRGVGIAVIDSGVWTHDDLKVWGTSTSRIVYAESFVPGDTSTTDRYGHGTHVAGIVAGNGYDSRTRYENKFQGVAPAANIINLKVLDKNGIGTDSAVINAIQRAIQLKDKYNIRVMNLSLGRPVYESFTEDPLCQAVEQAWAAGIAVVVAAGNSGRDNSYGMDGYGTIGVPGNDPYVITVGAMDTQDTDSTGDDKIATYSSKGPTLIDHVVKPDLVAPGNQVVSLLVPNSTLVNSYSSEDVYPCSGSVCNASVGTPQYFTMSGTSMATPIVSGAVALMLQKDPSLTPDMVKARLMKTADKNLSMYTTGADRYGRTYRRQYDLLTYGAGYLDIADALNNYDRATGTALSPRVLYNSYSRLVVLDSSNWASKLDTDSGSSVLWGRSVLWGTSVLWGNSVVWGNSALLNASSVLWGNSVVWGNSSNKAFSVIWGSKAVASTSSTTQAFSEVDSDCQITAAGKVVCK